MTVLGDLSLDDPSAPFTRRSWRASARRALRSARERIGDDPLFLPVVLRATPAGTSRALQPDTRLVIEGYPRSGNTFAYFALKHAEAQAGRTTRVSSHVHVPAQVKLAVRLRYPTLVVVRQPLDAVVSLLIAAPHVRFDSAIAEWIHHHEELLPYRGGFVVGAFTDVTKRFAEVTDRVNERFGTDFARFDGTPESTEAVFAAIDRKHAELHGGTENVVARPSQLRRAEKDWLVEQLSAPRFKGLLEHADGVHSLYVPAG